MYMNKAYLVGFVSLFLLGCTAAPVDTKADQDGIAGNQDASEENESAHELCEEENGGCHANAECYVVEEDGDEEIECECLDFYEGDGFTCTDIDECLVDNGGCGDPKFDRCVNYEGDEPGCEDIDECATNNGECGDAKFYLCTNNDGAPATCADIDECATNNGGCGDATYFTCANNAGAAATCADIDECATNNGGCGDATYSTCTNNDGAAPTCADIDECLTNNGGCDATYYTCTNNVGAAPTCVDIDECVMDSFVCGDPLYYSCTNNDGAAPTCADIDECTTDNGGCGDATYSKCTNNIGAQATCEDIDECATNNGGCDPTYYTCMNNSGAAVTCMDIDECLDVNSCGGTAYYICENNVGAAPTCTDVDECALMNGACGDATYFSCTNNVGAEPTCADIDECATSNGGCGDATYTQCSNNEGGLATCTDINECATNNGGCGDATYYSCADNVGAAATCADINECTTNNGGCGDATYYSCTDNVGAAPTCADIDECATNNGGCDATYFTCTNNTGAQPTCVDINECATNNGGCGNSYYYICMNNTGMAPTCTPIAGCDETLANCESGSPSPYPANPTCNDFSPICDTPQTVPWMSQELWTAAAADASQGAARVLEGSHLSFHAWKSANTSYDHSTCVGAMMGDCCLIKGESEGFTSCPVPYNDKVLTVVKGDRLTVRLPPSPCDPSDTIPLSGYSKITAGTLLGHQIGLCNEADGVTKYGCIHIDGNEVGPGSLLVTGYYGTKQGECSAAQSFTHLSSGGGSSLAIAAAFGTFLDDKFNNGATGLPGCCLNTMMLTVNVVEPILGTDPPALSRDFGWEKARMAKGGVMLCNVSEPICQAMQEPLRTVIAAKTGPAVSKSDVWVNCKNGDFQKSNQPGGIMFGNCADTSFLEYEVYMESQPFVSTFLTDPTGLQTAVNRNDGTENTTGWINGPAPYNYVFVEDVKTQVQVYGLGSNILLGQAKASFTDYQVYKSNASSDFATRSWEPMTIDSWGTGVTSVAHLDALNGRTTVLSAESQMDNCSSSANPYCVGLARHNEIRAQAGLQELQWDTAMATTAKNYADELCYLNTTVHSSSGPNYNSAENIYSAVPGAGEDLVDITNRGVMMARAVESWNVERNFYNYSRGGANCQTNYLYTAGAGADSYARLYGMSGPSVYSGSVSSLIPDEEKMTGHFTLMMQAKGTKIGCGAVQCSELGATDASMLSPQDRWVTVCHYDKGNSTGEFPFSERAARAITHDLETAETTDDTSLCVEPCDGAMTTAERADLQAVDAQVVLTDSAAADYSEPPAGQCLVPALPQGNYVPASE